MAALSGPIFAILVLLVVILGVQVANISTNAAMQAQIQNTLNANEPCNGCAQANMDLKSRLYNVLPAVDFSRNQIEPGMAVSDQIIIVTTNQGVAFIDKATQVQLGIYTISQFWGSPAPGEQYIWYDEIDEHFFLIGQAGVSAAINIFGVSPPSIVGSYLAGLASFSVDTFSVTGLVVASVPTNGCSTFTNPGAIFGNIALVQRGSCSFATKALNAQAAGATAVIFYNTINQVLAPSGTAPGLGIPAVLVSSSDGALLLSTLNPTMTLSATPSEIFSFGYLFAAASATSAPLSPADFFVDYFLTNYTAILSPDYCKGASSPDTVFIACQTSDVQGFVTGGLVVALDKTALVGGSVSVTYDHFFDGEGFPGLSQLRTPVSLPNQPVYIVSPGVLTADPQPILNASSCLIDTLYVRWATSAGITNTYTPISVKLPTTVCWASQAFYGNYIRQPLPKIQVGLDPYSTWTERVHYNNSVWLALSANVSTVHQVVFLAELDVTEALVDNKVTL